MMNNCFVKLYDSDSGEFFFKRVEPILHFQEEAFVLLDSIFSKVITVLVNQNEKQNCRTQSIAMNNYMQSFETLSIEKLFQLFPNFKKQWSDKFRFSY